MPRPFDFGRVELEAGPQSQPAALLESETPFRVLLLGDFGGRANRGLFEIGPALAQRPVLRVDRDNFDQVLARLRPSLQLGPHLGLTFRELDDFHPDRLYQSLEIFHRLRDTRQRLADAASFPSVARELALIESESPAPELAGLTSGSLLEQAIEATQTQAPSPARDPLADYIRCLVAPYLVPKPHPRQEELVARIDQAIAGLMRALLHQPAFQALEAAWRGVFFLVRRLETDGRLRIYLLDLSRDELAADLAAGELVESGLYSVLVEHAVGTPGGEAWSVVAGNYVFEQSAKDAELLA
ncbi:MAG: type VI secretion system contractile sheath domain-containing protein, partial [Bryobacteraceae bacterium]